MMDPPDRDILRLESVLDLKAASSLHHDLVRRRGEDLEIDAASVSRLGGQCLQVLLAGVVAWRSDGRALVFHAPSAAFLRALELFGFGCEDGALKELCS